MKTKNMTTLHLRKSSGWPPLWHGVLLIPVLFAWFALSPTSLAQLPSPSPDGGYPNANTAEGDGALANLTTGGENTANGFDALFSNTTGPTNTALGVQALFSNTTGSDNTAYGLVARHNNTTGSNNIANGGGALANNA